MKKIFGNYCGFSLIELMVTLAVVAILLTIGVPSFSTMIKNSRLATATNNISTAISFARSEAIKRGVRVTICTSSDGASCDAASWDDGWIVFTDEDSDAAYDAGDDELLRVSGSLNANLTVTGSASINTYISYINDGQSQLVNGGFQAGTLSLCDDRTGDFGRSLFLSNTGRLRLAEGVACP